MSYHESEVWLLLSKKVWKSLTIAKKLKICNWKGQESTTSDKSLTAMLVRAVLQTTLLDFKGLLKYLLEIQGSLMFDKIYSKEAYKTLRIGSFWIILDQIGSYWIILDRIGSDWIILDHIGSDWIKLDQIGSDWNWIRLDHIGSDWIRSDQIRSY